jgi:hypothetical protein
LSECRIRPDINIESTRFACTYVEAVVVHATSRFEEDLDLVVDYHRQHYINRCAVESGTKAGRGSKSDTSVRREW